jgi:hypothetical protein
MRDREYIPCDACGSADAMYLINLVDGQLYFCGHHYNDNKDALDKVAFETIELNKTEDVPQLEKADM